MMDNGLVVNDCGFRGSIVETREPAYSAAQARCAALRDALPRMPDLSPGARVLLVAIVEGVALHRATLSSLGSVGKATLYRCGESLEVEMDLGGGWRDRRVLPTPLVEAIRVNRGCVVSSQDWRLAAAAVRSVECYSLVSEAQLDHVIADAQAWWYAQLPGPLFSHVTRDRPFQVLDRSSRARISNGCPQISTEPRTKSTVSLARHAYDSCFAQSCDMTVIETLVREFGRIYRSRRKEEKGRDDMIKLIKSLIPKAQKAGRAQTLVLGGIAFVIEYGGVRGKSLAPVSVYEYTRQHLVGLTADLATAGVGDRSGEQWLASYRAMVNTVASGQKGKLASFLQAFHYFLVTVGMEPLPGGVQGQRIQLPPAAAVVTEHELHLALAFVQANAKSEAIAAQASLALLLGFEVALRTYELWCIRMVDVQLDHPASLVVYPRLRDGVGKTPSVRRQVDLHSQALLARLVAFVRKRQTVDHAYHDDDLLFGEPGAPDRRHEPVQTMRLVNAALVWATGDRRASFYDLRHAVFSRKARVDLMGA